MQAFFVVKDEMRESPVIVSVLIGGNELSVGIALFLFLRRVNNATVKSVACRDISASDVYDTSC